MFQKIVEKILSPILSEYVEDFNAENMKIGLWSGEVVIKNVKLRKQIIKKLNLPFRLKYSRLGTLKMNIPWKSLSSSKIQILIDGLQLMISQIPQKDWECKNTKIIEKRKQQLVKFCESIVDDFTKKSANAGKQQEQKGYFSGMIVKIIDNIQVTIKDIHVRYEDYITNRYSFGITLQQLKIFTVNKKGEPQFVDRTKKQYENQPLRKKLILSNFGVYWNEHTKFFPDVQPHNEMVQSIARTGQAQNADSMNYLILMSSNALLHQRQSGKQYVEPQINLFIEFQQLKIKVSNMQLQQIVTMSERLQSYLNEVKVQNRKKLTQQEMLNYHKQFLKIFPAYFQKKSTPQENDRIQTILQKMQVQNFQQGIKSYLKTKQKQKMVQQKMDKKKGWFSFSKPKQLTEEQLKQIQNFVKDNFGTQTKIVKRPQDFYYIKVNFKLKLLSVAIANTKGKKKYEEGLYINLQQILIDFNLRQGGYLLNFGMDDLNINMYKKLMESNEQPAITKILQKMPSQAQKQKVGQYAKLRVVGNPLQKKNLDTQIILYTQQLLIEFDPRLIKVAQDFADIKISSQNTQAALQAYGDIKNKVATAATEAATSISKSQKKKNFISLDVNLNSINLLLYFDPAKIDSDVWIINLGVTKITSDEQTLKKPEFTADEPMQKYIMTTTKMSMVHYPNKNAFFYSRVNNVQPDPKETILNDLTLQFQLQMFQKPTLLTPKIRSKAIIHNLDLNLSPATYQALQQISNCFSPPAETTKSQIQSASQIVQVEKVKANQKTEIMKESKKIGIVFDQSDSKQPKKFIGVVSGGYLYFFIDKKDVQYSSYYYLKNSKLSMIKEQDPKLKPFSLVVENVVNKFKLGFEKQSALEQWKKSIQALQTEDFNKFLLKQTEQQESAPETRPQVKPADPNLFNFELLSTIEKVSIKTYLYSDRFATISINNLSAHARIFQAKTLAKIGLMSIEISDNIYQYKYAELTKFLYSQKIEGKDGIIWGQVQIIGQKHPEYKQVGASVKLQVGKLVCNYKPETVEHVMKFFLPPKQKAPQASPNKLLTLESKKSSIDSTIHEHTDHHQLQNQQKRKLEAIQLLKKKQQTFVVNFTLKVQQISISLVNRKSRTMFARVGLNGFLLNFALSNKKMLLVGAINQIFLHDHSQYPNTIIHELAEYPKYSQILSKSQPSQMLSFNIAILQIPNQYNKTMLIKCQLNSLKVSYDQQPVLRLITYLTEQMLPSLTPSTDEQKKQQQRKLQEKNFMKPSQSVMDIDIQIENVVTIIQPRNGLGQSLELGIKKVIVTNSNILQPYIKDAKNPNEKVLVQNYRILVQNISIVQKLANPQRQIKLTNDLNIELNCELVQNSPYYRKEFGNRYEAGMRVSCKLSPFLMRINHDDYNFIMKCLFWNITYDDNAEGYLFDGMAKKSQPKKQSKEQSMQASTPTPTPTSPEKQPEPLYCAVTLDRIILCVTENGLPLSVLFLANLGLNLSLIENNMRLDMKLGSLFGTHVYSDKSIKGQQNYSIQKGMINLFGYQRKLQTKQLYDIENLVQIYSVDRILQQVKQSVATAIQSQKQALNQNSSLPVLSVQFQSNSFDTFISLKLSSLNLAIELKNLLVLSKLALMEPNIQPPKSILEPKVVKKKQQAPPNAGKTVINVQIDNFLGSLSDSTGKNYVAMEGSFLIKLKMEPSKSQAQVLKLAKQQLLNQPQMQQSNGKPLHKKFLDVAAHVIQIRSFSLYFCNLADLKNKRYILLPIKAYIVYGQNYGVTKALPQAQNQGQTQGKAQDVVYLQTNIDGQMDRIIIECSIRDMLMINKIAQDNLQVMTEYNKQTEKKNPKPEMKQPQQQQQRLPQKSQISSLKKNTSVDKNVTQKTTKQLQKRIKDKMKADLRLQPIQLRVINDCNSNFMPVLNFMIEESTILFSSDAIKTHLTDSLVLRLDFFNAKSASWEPVIQNFKISVDFLTLVGQYGPTSKIIISSTQIEQLKELKINLSTQLVTTLLTTMDLTKSEKQKLEKPLSEQTQISPYILQNQTNKLIKIERSLPNSPAQELQIKPLFKGPVKLTDQAKSIAFWYDGKRYQVALDQYGRINVPGIQDMHLQFGMEKEKRMLNFVNEIIIKNATFTQIYCLLYFAQKQKGNPILLAPSQSIPVQPNQLVQFSFNSNSYTPPMAATALLNQQFLVSESSKFKISITHTRLIMSHSVLTLRSPFCILNCLPKDVEIQFLSNGKQLSSKRIQAQGMHEVFANMQVSDFKFKTICQGFYWSQEFNVNNNMMDKQCELYLTDREKGGTNIKYIFARDQKRNQIRLNLFCSAFIISELDYDLQIYANLASDEAKKSIEKYYKLGGQSQFWTKQNSQEGQRKIDKKTLIGSESGNKIRICGRNCLPDFSQPVLINNIGVSQTRAVVERQLHGNTVCMFTNLGVEVELRRMAVKADIYCRQITIRSRWIFNNNTRYRFLVREQSSQKYYYAIESGQKKPFDYVIPQLKQKPKNFVFRTQQTTQSIAIMANGLGTIYFKLQLLAQPKFYIFFRLNIQQIQSYLFYTLQEVPYSQLPYQIVVKSPRLQAFAPLFQTEVRKDTQQPLLFINQIPTLAFRLQLYVRLVGSDKHQQLTVDCDNLNYREKLRFYQEGLTQTMVLGVVYVIFSDSRKYIVIDQVKEEEQSVPQYQIQTINFKLQKLSLSLIQNSSINESDVPFQSFYMYFQNLQFMQQKTNKSTRYQAKLQFLQLDQEQPFNIPNPVVITPIKFKQFTSTDPKDKPKSIFNGLVEIDNSFVKNLFVNEAIVDINDIVVKVGSQFIKIILQIVKQYQQAAKSEDEYLIKINTNTWSSLSPPPETTKTFIKSLRIAPFTVDISAQIRLDQLDKESVLFFGTILNALGVVITNIQDAPIVFDGIAINDCIDSISGLNAKLVQHYKGSVLRQLYKIFGALNIIGNPVSLFRNISTGFKDLKDKPSQGFVQGPLEFGKGLAEGTSSLIAHSVGGALNSVEKVTGTLATGLAALTFDKQFQQMRQRQKMKKPKHVLQGLSRGGKAVFTGFKQGITGLFLKPVQNAKKQGVLGFLKGTAQGVTGLVVKPVTGVIDFASKTTQGLKNTALYLEDKPNQNRIRYPRVLYTQNSIVKQYNEVDAKLLSIIKKPKFEQKYKFKDPYFMQSFKVSDRSFLVILSQHIILIKIDEQTVDWAASLMHIKISRIDDRSFRLDAPPKNKQFWQKSVSENLNFADKDEADRFERLINDMIANLGKYGNQRD